MDDNRILATFHAYDQDEVRAYAHLYDYIGALHEIQEYVRVWHKHGDPGFQTVEEAIEAAYKLILDAQTARGLEV